MKELLLSAFVYLFSMVVALAFLILIAKLIVWPIVRWYIKKCKDDPRYLVILVLLMLSLTANAQLKPKVAVSYNITNQIRIENPIGDTMTYYMPKFNFRTGLEYVYKNVSVYYDMQFWCLFSKDSFLPEQGSFEVGIKYNVTDKIKITINHTCLHPLQTEHHLQNKLFGGHQGITISYGY